MLRLRARRIFGLGHLLMLPATGAETLFIVDRAEAELHAEKAAGSPVCKRLPTGTPVKVLNRADGWTEVRTTDDTRG